MHLEYLLNKEDNVNTKIYNAQGVLIADETSVLFSGRYEKKYNSLLPGTYFLRTTTSTGTKTNQILIF